MKNFLIKICGTVSNISFNSRSIYVPIHPDSNDDVKEKHGVLEGFWTGEGCLALIGV